MFFRVDKLTKSSVAIGFFALSAMLSGCDSGGEISLPGQNTPDLSQQLRTVATRPKSASNWLENSSFESGIDGWNSCIHPTGTAQNNHASQGNFSIEFGARGCVFQGMSVTPGAELTFTCDAQVNSHAHAETLLGLTFYGGGQFISEPPAQKVTNRGHFQSYSVHGTAPHGSTFVGVWFSTNRSALLDNCSLVQTNAHPAQDNSIAQDNSQGQNNSNANTTGCVIGGTSVDTVLPRSQCDALVSFYESTGGPNWTNQMGWNTPTDPCNWGGIVCAGNNVAILDIVGNGLNGPIPNDIANLTELNRLSFAGPGITGPLPAALGNLQQLTEINFESVNTLSGPIPPELGNLNRLQSLILNAKFSGPIPATLGNLSNLVNLRIESTHITGSIPRQLANLSNLRRLNISNTQITGPIPSGLGHLVQLERLRLNGNRLTGPIPDLSALSRLSILDLTANQLSRAIPRSLGSLSNLTSLQLSGNRLKGEVPSELINMRNTLESLFLEHNDCLVTHDAVVTDWLNGLSPGWDSGCH